MFPKFKHKSHVCNFKVSGCLGHCRVRIGVTIIVVSPLRIKINGCSLSSERGACMQPIFVFAAIYVGKGGLLGMTSYPHVVFSNSM